MDVRTGKDRHLSEVIPAGPDAADLGHGNGDTTTLKVYAAWVSEADQRASTILMGRMSNPPASAAGRRSGDGPSGSALASDLTWPQLQRRWADTPPAEPVESNAEGVATNDARMAVLVETTRLIDTVTAHLRTPDADADAASEVLTSLAATHEGTVGGHLTDAAAHFDRAAPTTRTVFPTDTGDHARALRHASRKLAALGVIHGFGYERFALTALILAVAGLVAAIQAHQTVARPTRQPQPPVPDTLFPSTPRFPRHREIGYRPLRCPAPSVRPSLAAAPRPTRRAW